MQLTHFESLVRYWSCSRFSSETETAHHTRMFSFCIQASYYFHEKVSPAWGQARSPFRADDKTEPKESAHAPPPEGENLPIL